MAPEPRPREWWTLVAVCIATFMLLLDVTIVNVALPDLRAELDASFTDLQWVVDAYSLLLAALLLTAGSLADLYGRRLVFLIGLGIFTLASLGAGLAGSPDTLNIMRGLQGVGGAAMFATSLALLSAAYSGKDRAVAFGVWGATTGGAVAVGPVLGGVLTDGIGWESIFFVNVPIGLLAIGLTLRKITESRAPSGRRVDIPGVVLFSGALFALVFGLIRGNEEGWGSAMIVGLLGGSVALLAVFVLWERRARSPMLDLSLFGNRTFVGAGIVAFALSAAMFALFLYLTLYLQGVLDYSAFGTGIRLAVFSALAFFIAPVSGRLTERVPARFPMGIGLIFVGVGLISMSAVDGGSGWTVLLVGFILGGAGTGMINPPLASTAVAVVEPMKSGMASGMSTTFRQVGIATGIAGYGALFQHDVAGKYLEGLSERGVPAPETERHELGEALASGGFGDIITSEVPARFQDSARAAYESAFTGAFSELALIGGGFAVLCGLLGLWLIREEDMVTPPGAPPPSAPEREKAAA